MTDTDPRLEAVAKALRPISGIGKGLAKWWAELLCTGYDALRAFDQAQSGPLKEAHARCDHCGLFLDPPQPESEVYLPDAGLGDKVPYVATAPVMGADPPWLDEAASASFHASIAGQFYSFPPQSFSLWDEQSKERWRSVVRAVLAFANVQPPSEAEIKAAKQVLLNAGSSNYQNEFTIASALIAATKARSGA